MKGMLKKLQSIDIYYLVTAALGCVILALILTAFMVGYKIADSKDRGVFDEMYTLRKYNVAGSDDYIFVIDFVFDTHVEASQFVSKIERFRK